MDFQGSADHADLLSAAALTAERQELADSSAALPSSQHLGLFCRRKVDKCAYEGAVQGCSRIASRIKFCWGEIPVLRLQSAGTQYD